MVLSQAIKTSNTGKVRRHSWNDYRNYWYRKDALSSFEWRGGRTITADDVVSNASATDWCAIMKDDLIPQDCPHCGGNEIRQGASGVMLYRRCFYCGLSGPKSTNSNHAIELWNGVRWCRREC